MGSNFQVTNGCRYAACGRPGEACLIFAPEAHLALPGKVTRTSITLTSINAFHASTRKEKRECNERIRKPSRSKEEAESPGLTFNRFPDQAQRISPQAATCDMGTTLPPHELAIDDEDRPPHRHGWRARRSSSARPGNQALFPRHRRATPLARQGAPAPQQWRFGQKPLRTFPRSPRSRCQRLLPFGGAFTRGPAASDFAGLAPMYADLPPPRPVGSDWGNPCRAACGRWKVVCRRSLFPRRHVLRHDGDPRTGKQAKPKMGFNQLLVPEGEAAAEEDRQSFAKKLMEKSRPRQNALHQGAIPRPVGFINEPQRRIISQRKADALEVTSTRRTAAAKGMKQFL